LANNHAKMKKLQNLLRFFSSNASFMLFLVDMQSAMLACGGSFTCKSAPLHKKIFSKFINLFDHRAGELEGVHIKGG
jgi:hypothetical protein